MVYRNPIPTPCTDRHRIATAEVERAQQQLKKAHDLDESWLIEAAETDYDAAVREARDARVALFLSDEPTKPTCSAHGTTSCQRVLDGDLCCCFDHSAPDDGVLVGPPSVMIEPRDKFASHLVYRRPDGSEVVVPNVPHNQPIPWRVEYLRWQAERSRDRARSLRGLPFSESVVDDMTARAEQLDATALELAQSS